MCLLAWLKLAGRKRSREILESREIVEVGKSEEVGFKARKKLIIHKRGEKLRKDRSANLSLVATGGRVRHR